MVQCKGQSFSRGHTGCETPKGHSCWCCASAPINPSPPVNLHGKAAAMRMAFTCKLDCQHNNVPHVSQSGRDARSSATLSTSGSGFDGILRCVLSLGSTLLRYLTTGASGPAHGPTFAAHHEWQQACVPAIWPDSCASSGIFSRQHRSACMYQARMGHTAAYASMNIMCTAKL